MVITFLPDVPHPHWRKVEPILRRWMRVVSDRYGCSINLSVAMHLHLHLIVETPRSSAPLGGVLRMLASKIALEVNRRWKRQGPLFRDRPFTRVLRTLSELVRGIRYVAMNPVKARRCRRPENWHGSSVRDVIFGTPDATLWRFCGWMFRRLGFLDDARAALLDILEGRRLPVLAGASRQLRLPFGKGLPALPRG